MPYLAHKSSGFRVPVNYYATKPRFRPGYVPYSDLKVTVYGDDDKAVTGAKVEDDGHVSGLSASTE